VIKRGGACLILISNIISPLGCVPSYICPFSLQQPIIVWGQQSPTLGGKAIRSLLRFSPSRTALIAFVVCFVLVGAARHWANLAWQARGSEQFEQLVVEQQSEIVYQSERLGNTLAPVADHWSANGVIDRDDLQTFYTLMSNDALYSSLRGIGVIVAEQPSGAEFLIETVVPVGASIGLSSATITNMPTLAEAAAAARTTSQPQLFHSGTSNAEGDFFLIQPVLGNANEQGSQAINERQSSFLGWLLAPIDTERFFEASNMLFRKELGIMAYFDVEMPAHSTVPVSNVSGEAAHDAKFTDTIEISLFGLGWKIEAYSLPDLERLAENPVQGMQLLGTAIVSVAIAVLFQVLSERVKVVRRLVKERTRELSRRQRQQQSILDNALAGIISIDSSGEILFQNRYSSDLLNPNNNTPAPKYIYELIPDIDCVLLKSEKPISFDEVLVAGRTLRIGGSRWSAHQEHDRITLIVLDITDQIDTLLRFEAVQKRLDAAVSSSEIGVFDLDLANNVSIVSETWLRMMGLENVPPDFDAQAYFLACLHEEDRKVVEAADLAVIEGRAKRSIAEYRITIPGRGERWMRSDAALLEKGVDNTPTRFVGTQIDITDEKRAQASLSASEDRFRRIFHNAPTGNMLVNLDFEIIEFNQEMGRLFSQALRLSGKTLLLSQVFGNSWRDLEVRLHDLTSREDARIRSELCIEWADDMVAWLDVDVSLFQDPVTNQPIFFFQIIDTTRLHAADRAKDEFLATVSHELRTPITSIKGAAGLLEVSSKERMNPTETRMLEIINRNADRVTELVSDILDIESLRTGTVEVDVAPEPLDQILEETVHDLRPYAEKFGANLVIETRERGFQILADHRRAVQCLTNLVSNACKYGDHSSPVLIRTDLDKGSKVCVEVINQGLGVPEPFEDRLFTAFSRADTSDTRKTGGTGLGLKITKELMSRMGGDVTHHRDPKGRTVFTLCFVRAE
jgi:PAS domain S-box-containing protein